MNRYLIDRTLISYCPVTVLLVQTLVEEAKYRQLTSFYGIENCPTCAISVDISLATALFS